jgi:TfoX/Sxy family transcriptional regulator of competence genes
MDHPLITPEERYAAIVEEFARIPDVALPGSGRGFGSSELKIHNKIFAMLVRGRLVVKLPKSRVDELVAAGLGEYFDPRRDGRVMKEWICVEQSIEGGWSALAREAMEFVASKR